MSQASIEHDPAAVRSIDREHKRVMGTAWGVGGLLFVLVVAVVGLRPEFMTGLAIEGGVGALLIAATGVFVVLNLIAFQSRQTSDRVRAEALEALREGRAYLARVPVLELTAEEQADLEGLKTESDIEAYLADMEDSGGEGMRS